MHYTERRTLFLLILCLTSIQHNYAHTVEIAMQGEGVGLGG